MALNEQDRKEMLREIGLDPDGISLTPAPEAPARTQQTPVESDEQESEQPNVEELTDEQLLKPDAFERHKLNASEVGRAISSPHNKRLYARINDAKDRLRKSEQAAKRDAKAQRKQEDRTHVREKVKADTAHRAAQGVLEAMQEAGIDLDQLADLLKDRED